MLPFTAVAQPAPFALSAITQLAVLSPTTLVQLAPYLSSVLAQPGASADKQPADFAPDLDDKDANTQLKLSCRRRITKALGSKIRGVIADFKLFGRMSARPTHYFILASLGNDEATKVWRLHVAEAVADYIAFKKGVEALVETFEL